MSRKKYKATGCARFFVVMLILIPVAYFGAKMIRGGEGVPVIDNFIENIFSPSDDGKTASPNQSRSSDQATQDKLIRSLQGQVDDLRDENESLKKEIERLKTE